MECKGWELCIGKPARRAFNVSHFSSRRPIQTHWCSRGFGIGTWRLLGHCPEFPVASRVAQMHGVPSLRWPIPCPSATSWRSGHAQPRSALSFAVLGIATTRLYRFQLSKLVIPSTNLEPTRGSLEESCLPDPFSLRTTLLREKTLSPKVVSSTPKPFPGQGEGIYTLHSHHSCASDEIAEGCSRVETILSLVLCKGGLNHYLGSRKESSSWPSNRDGLGLAKTPFGYGSKSNKAPGNGPQVLVNVSIITASHVRVTLFLTHTHLIHLVNQLGIGDGQLSASGSICFATVPSFHASTHVKAIWLWVKANGTILRVGEFTTHLRTYFSGWIESDVHWGSDLDFGPWPLEPPPASRTPDGPKRPPPGCVPGASSRCDWR